MSKQKPVVDDDPINIKVKLMEAKKERLFETTQDLYNLSLKISQPVYKSQFMARVQLLERTRTDFIETVDNLMLAYLEDDPTVKPNYGCLTAFDELYCYIKSTENAIISENKNNSALHKPKLPALALVSFDGTPCKWPIFYENFKSIIHDNLQLSNTEKVQYLIGQLSGRALTVCSGIPPISANYEIIWQALISKYQDTRVQASLYLDKMLNFKSNQNIDTFIEHFCTSESALKQLKIDDLSDYIITHIALSKLDKQLVDLFEQTHRHLEIPTFKHVSQFLSEQSKIHMLRSAPRPTNNAFKDKEIRSRSTRAFVINSENDEGNNQPKTLCVLCNNPVHPLFKCSVFIQLNVPRRNDVVSRNRYCKNCLGFHDINECKSKNRCFVCQQKHHSLLHIDALKNTAHPSGRESRPASAARAPPAQPASSAAAVRSQSSGLVLHANTQNTQSSSVLLPTALVQVIGKNNTRSNLRALIDTGSMSHFITKECCDRLHLAIKPNISPILGIGQTESASLGFASFKIHSRFDNNISYNITARVINTITDKLPNAYIDTAQLKYFDDLPLADDCYDVPGEIDCLLGSELLPEIFCGDKVSSPLSPIVAIKTTLGYIVMGRAACKSADSSLQDNSCESDTDKNFFCSVDDSPSLSRLTERFWELESVPNKVHMSADDEACERCFTNTYSRDSTGRFIVELPFKNEPSELGDSYSIAKRRLLTLEKKLDACPDLRVNYNDTIRDYIEKGYLTEVDDFKQSHECYYMPHRAVYRPEKSSSKTRIIVDASCPTTSGKSLNDLLYKGPNLQNNIFELLINLRMFSTALTADIEKMYFQILLKPEHHSLQRILYRFRPDSKIRIFQFNRVSFGVTSSPYLAMRSVRQLATDSSTSFPLAAYETNNHFYMDDYFNSVDGHEKAEQIYDEMVEMFKAGGFNLTKWISNDLDLLNKIPSSQKNPQIIDFDSDNPSAANTKIVGMQWQPVDDYFQFKINSDVPECSKRTILSVTARLFDPLGLLCPVTAFMKLLVQDCWKSDLGWDDPAPISVHNKWIKFRDELPSLEMIKIPRHIGIYLNSHITIIGFSDASELCYGANVYVRVSSDRNTAGSVNLLTAKSKVASLQKMTLARLELCAALLLANLISVVRETLNQRCHIDDIYAFCDSTVTLTWIHSPSYKFHTFVANRITEINSKLPAIHWYHVRTHDNAADIISRPVTPSALLDCDMWFHGPCWLRDPVAEWPVKPFQINSNVNELLESKPVALVSNASDSPLNETDIVQGISERVSSWTKMLRVVVFVLRFMKLLPKNDVITVIDLEFAENYILRYVQKKHFAADIVAIKGNKLCSKRIIKLSPFIDENDQILRAGGRLKHSDLSFGQKHPILLPAKERITQLIVDHFHVTNLHTGPALLLPLLRQRYWILSARNLVRQRVHACNVCFRLNPKYSAPQMGDLPAFRVSEAKPFVKTSVDYGGPYYVTHIRHRGVKSHKAYICLFVCLTTKALHLELVSDLSAELFLAAFKRFISRRGPVALLYSDGATCFSGARTQLNEIYQFIQSTSYNNYLNKELLNHRIQFKRSPPYGPHFNGLCEINIRCVKTHLAKAIGTRVLTYEEFSTVLTQIEGLLNSRPLCTRPSSSDTSEIAALTPNHFLNVTPLKFLPAEDLTELPDNRLSRFQIVSKLTHIFWRRWSQEYLSSLQQREKWNTPTKPIKLGSVVVIKDQNAHPLSWPLGIVEEVYPGKDSIIRTCKVRTASGSYVRPVIRLAPLPSQ